jgi:cytochrome P450
MSPTRHAEKTVEALQKLGGCALNIPETLALGPANFPLDAIFVETGKDFVLRGPEIEAVVEEIRRWRPPVQSNS